GWIFTEMGRQPFVVAPNPAQLDGVYMYTQAALSPELSPGTLLFSLISLTAVYGGRMVVELRLLTTYVRGGVASAMPELASSSSCCGRDTCSSTDSTSVWACSCPSCPARSAASACC